MTVRSVAWRGRASGGAPTVEALKEMLLMHLRGPVEFILTRALRQLARKRPDVFERLGAAACAVYVIAPDGLPVCFRMEPRGTDGSVRVAPRASATGDVRISGPLPVLLRLFDGGRDADAAFFARDITVEGDIDAAIALHNALEAAELELWELARAAAPPLRELLDEISARLVRPGRGSATG